MSLLSRLGWKGRVVLMGLLVCVAFGLAVFSWVHNLEQTCFFEEWPHEKVCPPKPSDPASQITRLKQRIAQNPGDTESMIKWLVLDSQQSGTSAPRSEVALDAVTRLAPQDPRIQRLQANRALRSRNWEAAVTWLVRLVRNASDGNAALVLARLTAEPIAMKAMLSELQSSSTWLPQVIGAMPAAKMPTIKALPLIIKAQSQSAFPSEMTFQLIAQMKAGGFWLEAHTLWLAWLNKPSAVLYNGSFDATFVQGGFDWEVTPTNPSRAGVRVNAVDVQGRGRSLEIELLARPLEAVLISHPVLLLGKRYTFSGAFKTEKLRTREGLAWVLRCANEQQTEMTRVTGLTDSGEGWKSFAQDFEVPANCGAGANLQLQAQTQSEALLGMRGVVLFDDMKIEVR